MYVSRQQAFIFKATLSSLASKSEEEIIKKCAKYDDSKVKGLYLQNLTQIKESIAVRNLKNLKKFCKLIAILNNVMSKEALKSHYESDENPIGSTNLVILACRHNNAEALEYIFDSQSKILENLSVDIGFPSILPNDEDEECHNPFYYAICSNNVNLLTILVEKWSNRHFESRPDELDAVLSKAYDEVKLKNILLLTEMEFFVEDKLIAIRFFSEAPVDCHDVEPSLDNVKERIGLVLESTHTLIAEYSGEKDVDEKFILSARFIVQNIHVLKAQLKPMYAIIPWEEVEFCLTTFIKLKTIHGKMILLCDSILTKTSILNHLNNFAGRLKVIGINTSYVSKTFPCPANRDTIIRKIANAYPPFQQLYKDYEQVVDLLSLSKIFANMALAVKANPHQEYDRLVIARSLQIIGECLKNTLGSPKLSSITSKFLLVSVPTNMAKTLRDLRNSLVDVHSISIKSEVEKTNFFANVQNDLAEISDFFAEILVSNINKSCQTILKNIIKSTSLREIEEIVQPFYFSEGKCLVDVPDNIMKTFETGEHSIGELVKKLDMVICKANNYERAMLDKVNTIITMQKKEFEHNEINNNELISMLRELRATVSSIQTDDEKSRQIIKLKAKEILMRISLKIKPQSLKTIAEMFVKIACCVRSRLQPEVVNEINRLVLQVLYAVQFELDDVNWIVKVEEKLIKNKFIRCCSESQQNESSNASSANKHNQLGSKLSVLKKVLNNNGLNDNLNNNYPLYMKNEKLQAVVEMLVQDVISILESRKNILTDNVFFLDDSSPSLIGKALHNYLVHGSNIIDILPFNPSIAVIANAKKLISETGIIDDKKCIGKFLEDCPSRLKDKHNQDLQIIANQGAMFAALEKGDLEALKSCIKKGADLNARNVNSWTALHFACKGSDLDVVKFIFNGRMQNLISDDGYGNSALHIAAAYGRESIVEYLVKERGFSVNDANNDNQMPLHLAAQKGYKSVIKLLLKMGATPLCEDNARYSPIAYAVANDHKNVLILFKNEKFVDNSKAVFAHKLLNLAAERGYVEVVNFLLQRKASVNATDNRNWTPLHTAAVNGHFKIVQVLILRGADVGAKTPTDKCTPLHYSVQYRHKNIVKVLLKHGANVNAADVHNRMPLHYAAKGGYIEIVEILLKSKANINVVTVDGMTALHLAAKAGHKELIDLLIKNNATISAGNRHGLKALHLSSLNGHTDVVEILVEKGAKIDCVDKSKRTPLLLAGVFGHKEVVELLLANGANLDAIDNNGNTALHLSSENCREGVVQVLINKGAKLDARNNSGRTPLHSVSDSFNENINKIFLQYATAVDESRDINIENEFFLPEIDADVDVKGITRRKIVESLLDKGADIHATCKDNFTPLHLAARSCNIEVVKVLLERKADVNAKGCDIGTALHMAVHGNCKKIIETLIENGSNVNAKDHTGMTPLFYAVKYNYSKIVKLLLVKGADISADASLPLAVICGFKTIVRILLENKTVVIQTQTNETLLHLAAERGFKDILEALIRKGADVNAVNDNNLTPLHLAAQEGHKEVVEVLLKKKANLNPWSDQCGTPLHVAAGRGHIGVVEVLVLLSNGIHINVKDNESATAIELATACGHLQVVKMLLQCKDFNVNAKGNNNWTILHIASQEGNLQIVRCLVDAGADLHAKNILGSTPMHIAAREGHTHVVKFFITNGCHVNSFGANGWTSLHYAISKGRTEVVKYLVQQDIDVNSIDDNGLKPIHLAIKNDYEDITKELLTNGAIYNDMDKFGQNPMDLAKSQNVIKLLTSIKNFFDAVKCDDLRGVKMCIKEGVVINAKDSDNMTPLHYASWKGYKRVVDVLLKHKANANLVDKEGSTPLHYAAKFSHLEIVKALLSSGASFNILSHNSKTPSDLATNKEIVQLLKLIEQLFEKVFDCNPDVINYLPQIKAAGLMKSILNARDREGKTLITVAVSNDFLEMLKDILRSNNHSEVEKAHALCLKGKYQESLNILQNVLITRRKLFGPDNPLILEIQVIISNILSKQKKYQEAMDILQNAYVKLKAILGQNNIITLDSRYGIASILCNQGKFEEALKIYEEVYKVQKEILGETDSNTLRTQSSIASVFQHLKRYEEAQCMYYEVFEIHKKTMGASDPLTLSNQDSIAFTLTTQGKYEEAYEILKQVYETQKKVLGPAHSDSSKTAHKMIGVRLVQGKHDQAFTDYQALFELQKSYLGANHLDILDTQDRIADLLFQQGKYVRAMQAYNDCLNQRLAILGPNHPSILGTSVKCQLITAKLEAEGCDVKELMKHIHKDIFIAAKDGDRIIQDLINEGIDVNAKNVCGRTPLHIAVSCGHKDIVNILLRNGADSMEVSNKGNTSLHFATTKNNIEIVEILLQHIKQESPNRYDDFLHAQTMISGSTSLHIAVKNGFFSIVKCLLKNGVIYDIVDKSNKTPLDYSENKDITNLLNLTNQLFDCTEKGMKKVNEKLNQTYPDEFQAIVSARNSEGETAINLAIYNENMDIANVLMKMLEEKSLVLDAI